MQRDENETSPIKWGTEKEFYNILKTIICRKSFNLYMPPESTMQTGAVRRRKRVRWIWRHKHGD